MSLVFLPLDSYYFSNRQLSIIRTVRFLGLVPMVFLLLYGGVENSFRWVFLAVSIALYCFTWTYVQPDFLNAASAISYYFLLSLPMTLLTYALFRVQFRFGLLATIPANALTIHTMLNVDTPRSEQLVLAFGVTGIYLTLVATMYFRERSEREQFILEQDKLESLQRQASADRERAQWYQTLSQFLRHELAVYLVGIRTSFELLDRFPEQRSVYSERGQQSLREMQLLLRQAAEATSIDGALQIEEREAFDLSAVVADCVEEYFNVYPAVTFSVSLDNKLMMAGQAYRIRQLLDKLVSNAARHQNGTAPVVISLHREVGFANLVVENRGDPLPDETDIFALWTKGDSGSGERRHGLGLYVANKIASAHGGTIKAKSLVSPKGARFTVTLPML